MTSEGEVCLGQLVCAQFELHCYCNRHGILIPHCFLKLYINIENSIFSLLHDL